MAILVNSLTPDCLLFLAARIFLGCTAKLNCVNVHEKKREIITATPVCLLIVYT